MIISPLLFPGPERATILLLEIHSAESKQSELQIINPVIKTLNYSCLIKVCILHLPIMSSGPLPKFSPRIVTRVPGGPSLGETPVTIGGSPISSKTS